MREPLLDLGRRTAWSVVWAMLGTGAAKLIVLGSLAVLARLLAPAEFGLFAFAVVYIAYLETIGDLGAGAALIYWRERTTDVAQVTFVLNLVVGLAWFALTWGIAPSVAGFFQTPAGTPILRALGIAFVLKALGNTHDSLCRKDLRFKARLVPETGLAVVKAAVTVTFAAWGFGVWSLVWGHLAATGARSALLWIVVPWRPTWRWPVGLLGPVLRYGRWIVVVNALAAIVHHADYVIVGRALGMTALGWYQMAYKLPEALVIVLAWQASMVLFPAFSRAGASGHSVANSYLTALRYLALLAVPIALGLFFLAEPLVLTLFGDAWRPSIPLLRALAVYAGLRALSAPGGDILKAQGRPHLLAALGTVKALVLVPALLVAARWGTLAIAGTLAAVAGVTLLLNVAVLRFAAGLTVRATLGALRPTLAPTLVLAGVLFAWTRLSAGEASLVVLAGGLALGMSVYLVTALVSSPDLGRHALAVLRGVRPRAGGAVDAEVARAVG